MCAVISLAVWIDCLSKMSVLSRTCLAGGCHKGGYGCSAQKSSSGNTNILVWSPYRGGRCSTRLWATVNCYRARPGSRSSSSSLAYIRWWSFTRLCLSPARLEAALLVFYPYTWCEVNLNLGKRSHPPAAYHVLLPGVAWWWFKSQSGLRARLWLVAALQWLRLGLCVYVYPMA